MDSYRAITLVADCGFPAFATAASWSKYGLDSIELGFIHYQGKRLSIPIDVGVSPLVYQACLDEARRMPRPTAASNRSLPLAVCAVIIKLNSRFRQSIEYSSRYSRSETREPDRMKLDTIWQVI